LGIPEKEGAQRLRPANSLNPKGKSNSKKSFLRHKNSLLFFYHTTIYALIAKLSGYYRSSNNSMSSS
jgi:hypothetical protein